MKPFAEACEQNKHPILQVLRIYFTQCSDVLEIGSGTGQHAVFFAEQFPTMIWHCSDVAAHHDGIRMWMQDYNGNNISGPYELDVSHSPWPARTFDAVFSANTTHIMSWQDVMQMFHGIGEILQAGRYFCLYGPFNYAGQYTSESNASFDRFLKQRDPLSGLRDVDDLQTLAHEAGLVLIQDHAMPVNNRTLVWQKQ